MKFKDTHPDYENYTSETHYYDHLPPRFFDAFQGLIVGAIENSEYPNGKLRAACDVIARNIPTKPTSNTGWSWLINDLDDFVRQLKSKKLNKILDTVAEVVDAIEINIDDINEVFEEIMFGFRLDYLGFSKYQWVQVEGTESYIESIEEAFEDIPKEQINVLENLMHAKKQIRELSETRSRKEALRNCISALESQLKYYSGEKKMEDAISKIKDEYNIPRKIISDAKLIWDRIHDQTPDVRHGSHINSELSEAEALYWIDRITALVKYLAREIE
jgi:hypothetical protein